MLEYKKAPYIELDNYKIPAGGTFIYIPMQDNKNIRLAYWQLPKTNKECRGTVLLQQGHNEFIEKYYETIQDLIDRNFNVISFDWRGQGMSDRMINNKNKQYVEDFSIHCQDLTFIINEIIYNKFPKPLIGIGHSMGGHLLLLSQENNQDKFSSIILSAPMLGFKYEKLLFLISSLIMYFTDKESYFYLSKPNMGKEIPFEQNDLTSDYKRYERTQKLVRKKNQIRLWGVTNAWVNAAKNSLLKIRKKKWLTKIDVSVCIVNPLNDRVVCPKETIKMAKKLNNCKIINVKDCEHEILMEKDQLRAIFWRVFDDVLDTEI